MILLLIFGLAGCWLGLNYRVLILLPASVATAILIAAMNLVNEGASTSYLLAIAGLQAGYVLGLAAREALGALFAHRDRVQSRRA